MKSLKIVSWLLVPALVAVPRVGNADWEYIYQAAQPLLVRGGESGVWIASVPYVGYDLDAYDSPSVVLLTVAPNLLHWDKRPAGQPPQPENRNLASLAGIRFAIARVENPPGPKRAVLRGDTLGVAVDVQAVSPWPFDEPLDQVIPATLWCGLLNARQAWPKVRFVDYEITAIPSLNLTRYNGVYSLAGIQPLGAAERWRSSKPLTDRCIRK